MKGDKGASIKDKEARRRYDRIKHKELRIRYRAALFEILGGVKCVKCGFGDSRALHFDHIYGGGRKQVKDSKSNMRMYLYYIKNPEIAIKTLQILCANCNWIKRIENMETSQWRVLPT